MVAGALADGFGNHRNSRTGRRQQSLRSGRQGQRSFRRPSFRRGRQEDLDAAAPDAGYGAAQDAYGGATEAPEVLPPPDYAPDYEAYDDAAAGALGAYGADDGALGVYAADDAAADPNLAMLEKAVPGIPGEDYPIFAEVPESGFSCDGQVDGGYYADAEAQCQVFHICTADGQGGLAKYSFLCPNGTIFNQNYFICDWWFNFDCAEAEALYSLNDEIAAERDALAGANDEALGGYGAPGDEAAPLPTDYEYTDYAAADYGAADYAAAGDYAAATAPADDYSAQSEYAATEAAPTEAPIETGYGAPGELDAAASADALLPTVAPELGAYEGEDREGRRGRFSGRRGNRGRGGRRGGSRRGRTGRARSSGNSRRNNRRQNNRRANGRRSNGGSRRQGRRFSG